MQSDADRLDTSIAIIGMACQFPKAGNLDEYWRNLREGRPCIERFSAKDAEPMRFSRMDTSDPHFIGAVGELSGCDLFDASFFGYSPKEAETIDPQQRLLLQCAWTCLEHAGYGDTPESNRIGVFAGTSLSSYLFGNVLPSMQLTGGTLFNAMIANDKDYVATRVSHRLNLKGLSVNLQAACSSSLLAVHMAALSILVGESDMALAGGVSIKFPQRMGYVYREGSIESSDGECRAFDERASGTVWGHGLGFVLLKPLRAALRDRDSIYAVIRGSAANNDGRIKAAFTAPSVEGQESVIREACKNASVMPQDLSYIETHGTGTSVGDSVELEALGRVLGNSDRPYCALGTVKPAIGHLDAAAGVASLIKAVLALHYKVIPPNINCERPTPALLKEGCPFYLNTQLREWPDESRRRVAGVSSFGVGGTNVHLVLEEAPDAPERDAVENAFHVIPISTRESATLEATRKQWIEYLSVPSYTIRDIAWTAQTGRKHFQRRMCAVGSTAQELIQSFEEASAVPEDPDPGPPRMFFLFPGQGTQYQRMGKNLYRRFPAFRSTMDACYEAAHALGIRDLRSRLFGDKEDASSKTVVSQLSLFAVESALADLFLFFGIRPVGMIGHSLGEYAAAYVAGVLSVPDAVRLVAKRAELVESLPEGRMLTVQANVAQIQPYLSRHLALAAVNSDTWITISGSAESIDETKARLAADRISCRLLSSTRAYHSAALDPILDEFTSYATTVAMKSPEIPYISNVTGKWITGDDFADGAYWSRHMRNTVLFHDGLNELLRVPSAHFLELGPARSLSALVRGHPQGGPKTPITTTLTRPDEPSGEEKAVCSAVAELWTAGIHLDWCRVNPDNHGARVSVPTYAFNSTSYWLTPGRAEKQPLQPPKHTTNDSSSFHVQTWKRLPSQCPSERQIPKTAVIFTDECGVGSTLAALLRERGCRVTEIHQGGSARSPSADSGFVRPAMADDFDGLMEHLKTDRVPDVSIYLWNIGMDAQEYIADSQRKDGIHVGIDGLCFWAKALHKHLPPEPRHPVLVVTRNACNVFGGDLQFPLQALVRGAIAVAPAEIDQVSLRQLDLEIALEDRNSIESCAQKILDELNPGNETVAVRGSYRWMETYEPIHLPAPRQSVFRNGGVYLITGGTGGLGLALAEHLAQRYHAHVVLTCRSLVPDRAEWELISTGDQPSDWKQKLTKMLGIERNAASLAVCTTDVTDKAPMAELVRSILERHGRLDGVVHAAGDPGTEFIRTKVNSSVANSAVAGKIAGAITLLEALRDVKMDFLALYSSIATQTPSIGQAAYSAANAFLDAYAFHMQSKTPFRLISLGWDAWKDVGMAHRDLERLLGSGQRRDYGLSPADAIEHLERALCAGYPHVIISRDEIATRKQAEKLRAQRLADSMREAGADTRRFYVRPSMSVPFTPVHPGLEESLEQAWRITTRVKNIGRDDNFFELGGDSLLAAQLVEAIRQIANQELPLAAIFEHPTIALQATFLEHAGAADAPQPAIPVLPRKA